MVYHHSTTKLTMCHDHDQIKNNFHTTPFIIPNFARSCFHCRHNPPIFAKESVQTDGGCNHARLGFAVPAMGIRVLEKYLDDFSSVFGFSAMRIGVLEEVWFGGWFLKLCFEGLGERILEI